MSSSLVYRNRRAAAIENDSVRVVVTAEGAHIAAIVHKPTGINPLWTPPWPSIEPSTYDRARHVEYGTSDEALVLSGIMGHSICLDTYGGPSPEEFACGVPVHGEAGSVPYAVQSGDKTLELEGTLPLAQLIFRRELRLADQRGVVWVREMIRNLASVDLPIAWTQHVTLGPPFVERGKTQFCAPVGRSKVIDDDFTHGRGLQKNGAEFTGLLCPSKDGGVIDLSVYPQDAVSGGFTIHLIDPKVEQAYFLSWSPTTRILFGYVWKRADFPWLCRWEENHLRAEPPWNSRTLTCAMEFGVSPMLESRRKMVDRGTMFGERAYRWVPARGCISAEYAAFLDVAESIPREVRWDGTLSVQFT